MKYLTPPEVAKLLRVRCKKVLAWIRSGELTASNVSNGFQPRYRIKESELEAFMQGRAVVTPPPARRRRRRIEVVKNYFPEYGQPGSS